MEPSGKLQKQMERASWDFIHEKQYEKFEEVLACKYGEWAAENCYAFRLLWKEYNKLKFENIQLKMAKNGSGNSVRMSGRMGMENDKKEVSKDILQERNRKIEERKRGILEENDNKFGGMHDGSGSRNEPIFIKDCSPQSTDVQVSSVESNPSDELISRQVIRPQLKQREKEKEKDVDMDIEEIN